ncbi:hypothetical protein AYK21_02200 [Thermoplasmatales archaeon SG8-52-2]|nr:MAG: hypothetical protein AYK21_02200 [Thermoplasmatales archaeon SG8-52-2]
MAKKIKITSILITLLFSNLLILPIINAEEQTDSDRLLTIWMPGITKDNYFRQIQITEEEIRILIDNINETLNVINSTLLPSSSGSTKITYEEWQQISSKICAFIDSIDLIMDDFPEIDTTKLVTRIVEGFFLPLPGFFRPKPIVSAGIGNTIIPFYDYETFLGRMIRPMLTRYQFGFTHIGGITRCRFTIGKYFIFNTRFCGMFINLGDICFEEKMGPTMYIGTVFTSRI